MGRQTENPSGCVRRLSLLLARDCGDAKLLRPHKWPPGPAIQQEDETPQFCELLNTPRAKRAPSKDKTQSSHHVRSPWAWQLMITGFEGNMTCARTEEDEDSNGHLNNMGLNCTGLLTHRVFIV